METLKKNYEFSRVYKRGKYFRDKNLTLNVFATNNQYTRYGISISKKIFKSSVKRNLYRRRIKEVLRIHFDDIKVGYDIVFVVKGNEYIPEFCEIEKGIINLLNKANLIVYNEENIN